MTLFRIVNGRHCPQRRPKRIGSSDVPTAATQNKLTMITSKYFRVWQTTWTMSTIGVNVGKYRKLYWTTRKPVGDTTLTGVGWNKNYLQIPYKSGLDGPGIESWWERDFPHPSTPGLGPTQSPLRWVPGLARGKAAGAWRWPPAHIYCRG
jgi:hypothetical protein